MMGRERGLWREREGMVKGESELGKDEGTGEVRE